MIEDRLHIAMTNSFNIIVLGYDWEEIVDGAEPYFAHNVETRVANRNDLLNLLKYFTEIEDFKKCIAINTYLDTHR